MKKIFSTKNIIITLLATVFLAGGIYLFYKNRPASVIINNNSNQPAKIVFPDPIFDGSTKVGDTGVIVEYPKKGFYDLGVDVKLTKLEPYTLGNITITPTAKSNLEKQGEYVTLTVGVRAKKIEETLKTVVDSFLPYKQREAIQESRYVNIGGHEMYIEKYFGDTRDSWNGLMIDGDRVIGATLYFSAGVPEYEPTPESIAAFNNNDKLFLQILEHIKF